MVPVGLPWQWASLHGNTQPDSCAKVATHPFPAAYMYAASSGWLLGSWAALPGGEVSK